MLKLIRYTYISDSYLPDFQRDTSKVNYFHDLLQLNNLVSMAGAAGMFSAFYVLDTSGALFVGSLLPSGLFLSPLKFILLLMHIYHAVVGCAASAVFAILMIQYGFYVAMFYTVELRLGLKSEKYRAIQKIRENPQILRETYRAFRVLHTSFLHVVGVFLFLSNYLFMISTIYLNFVLLRYWKNLKTFAKAPLLIDDFVGLFVWTGLMELGRILFQRGNKVINSWKPKLVDKSLEGKVMKRFRLSCKPLVLAYGKTLELKRGSILGFYKAVTRGTFRALVAK